MVDCTSALLFPGAPPFSASITTSTPNISHHTDEKNDQNTQTCRTRGPDVTQPQTHLAFPLVPEKTRVHQPLPHKAPENKPKGRQVLICMLHSIQSLLLGSKVPKPATHNSEHQHGAFSFLKHGYFLSFMSSKSPEENPYEVV